MKKQKIKIILIENDPGQKAAVEEFIASVGFEVRYYQNDTEALLTLRNTYFDLCILDVSDDKFEALNIPDLLLSINRKTPVIFVVGKNTEEDDISFYKEGMDAYIKKPYSGKDLTKLAKKLIDKATNIDRRDENGKAIVFNYPKMKFDYTNMLLVVKDNERKLTKKEAELLKFLLDNKNKVVTREETLMNVWGSDSYFLGRSMDVFLSKVRRYLKTADSISISNVHGIGFKLETKQ